MKNGEVNAKTISTPLVTAPSTNAASTPIPTATELLLAPKNVQQKQQRFRAHPNIYESNTISFYSKSGL